MGQFDSDVEAFVELPRAGPVLRGPVYRTPPLAARVNTLCVLIYAIEVASVSQGLDCDGIAGAAQDGDAMPQAQGASAIGARAFTGE